ncbi:MAG: glycosyltransferase family 39 protein [Symplocastrum torsivum CPER-KK1]|uniref:Glycosyltransferase family 39 protein n=1 Tax=Symplocastrum torsivum CPER-KK1 TaxID=450513 RepID=A0A951PGJ8_9CYAN|nr:glycosyltransferase family 39 protein [Symplocastrum torsivum CPER-KK1]
MHKSWLRFLIITILTLGVLFRFVNLDKKIYWHDENFTSLRVSGYTEAEMVKQVFKGQVSDVNDLQKYRYPNPDKNLLDTINSLAIEEPQHPPLYYGMVRFWMQLFGNQVAITRSLSALISLLAFPCIYWLCLELFNSSLVGWIAVALIAVSPFHVLYAQEAREYSLWTVTILASSAALLRALRLNTISSWILYVVTLFLSLYTFLFSGLVMIGQALYLLTRERFQFSKVTTNYLLASLLGLLTYVPWIFAIINNFSELDQRTSWTSDKIPFLSLVKTWVANPTRIFFDINLDSKSNLMFIVLPLLILWGLIGYSIYFLCRKASKPVVVFILALIGVTVLVLVLPDLIIGGRRSSVSRYLIPSYLGIQLAVAYLFSIKLANPSLSRYRIWQFGFLLLIIGGIVSCGVSSQTETWWIKKNRFDTPENVQIINQFSRPLLVSSNNRYNPGEILTLSYLLNPKVKLQLVTEPNLPKIPEGFSDILIFNPSKVLRKKLETEGNYTIKTVAPGNLQIFKLIKT